MLVLPRYKKCPQQSKQSQLNLSEKSKKACNKENQQICQLVQEQKEQYKELQFSQQRRYPNQKMNQGVALESSREQQFQNKLNQNRYTLNFSHRNKSQSLPKLISLNIVRQTLISEDVFRYFKKVNTKYGRYDEALRELEKIDEQKKYKLKLQNRMKIKTRKNIFEIQKSRTIEDIYDLFVYANTRPIKKQQKLIDLQLKNAHLSLQNSRKHTKMLSCSESKWKLRDFFDPIIQEQSSDHKKMQNIRSRLKFLSKVHTITTACDRIQEQNRSKTYLELFSKYSQKLDTNLHKKRRRLQKVQGVFKK